MPSTNRKDLNSPVRTLVGIGAEHRRSVNQTTHANDLGDRAVRNDPQAHCGDEFLNVLRVFFKYFFGRANIRADDGGAQPSAREDFRARNLPFASLMTGALAPADETVKGAQANGPSPDPAKRHCQRISAHHPQCGTTGHCPFFLVPSARIATT